VLYNGWKKGRIQNTKSATLGVDGDLAIKLKSAGFKLGVGGSRVMVTEFVIEAAFTPEASEGSRCIGCDDGVGTRYRSAFVVATQPCARRYQRKVGELEPDQNHREVPVMAAALPVSPSAGWMTRDVRSGPSR
jgi:hypothetical protein